MPLDDSIKVRLTKEEADYIRNDEESISEILRQALQLYFTEMADRAVKLGGHNDHI